MGLPRSRTVRWIAPLGAVAVVAGVAASVPALTAGAAGALPGITPQQLLVKAEQSHVTGLSGTVRVSADLGLPQLPAPSGEDASVQTMLSGTHILSVAVRGPQQQRIGIHGSLEQTELIHNGRDVWVYRSTANKVNHLRLPAGHASTPAGSGKSVPGGGGAAAMTPQALAKRALAAVTPSTQVTTDQQITVAGRAAYVLRLAPRSGASLIDHISIAVDGRTGAPLAVTVMPRSGDKPAIDVAYTSVNFTPPAASTFRFTPPVGAKVTTAAVTQQQLREMFEAFKQRQAGSAQRPTILGAGWAAVAEFRGVSLSGLSAQASGNGAQLMHAMLQSGRSVTGTYGSGTLWSSRLLTVLVTSNGRMFIGAVTPQAIESAAGQPAAR